MSQMTLVWQGLLGRLRLLLPLPTLFLLCFGVTGVYTYPQVRVKPKLWSVVPVGISGASVVDRLFFMNLGWVHNREGTVAMAKPRKTLAKTGPECTGS